MPDYSNAKIYKLVSKDLSHNLIYIGSTCQELRNRLAEHARDYKKYINNKYHWVTSFNLFAMGCVDIILLENIDCNNREQLHARERYWIENTENVNKCIPTRTQKEWRTDNLNNIKDKQKLWYQSNKDNLNIVFSCKCGGSYVKRNHKTHINTNRHKSFINNHIH